MSNRCYITIYLVGSNDAIAKAENSLTELFRGIWEEAKALNDIRVPRKKLPEYQWREYPPAYGYFLWYPWGPPSEGLDQVATDNPDVILAVMYDEMGHGFRGQRFYANGVVKAWHHGDYGPDGHELYDQMSPLPDFRTSLEYYIYTQGWRGKKAAFAEAEKSEPPKEIKDELDQHLE